MKILGLNQGEHGDMLISLPAIRHLCRNPDIEFTLIINKKFSKIAPFIRGLDYVKDIYISDGYDNFPSQIDINYLDYKQFDKIYNPMQAHSRPDWYNHYHYTEEFAIQHNVIGLNETKSFNRKIDLVKLKSVDIDKKIIGLAPYANGTDRSISKDDAQFIVNCLNKLNYKVMYFGINCNLENVIELKDNSLLNAGITLSNLAGFITVDTLWSWLASGYNVKTFGLYHVNYADMISQWSHFPANVYAKYIVNRDIKRLDKEMIELELTNWAKNIK